MTKKRTSWQTERLFDELIKRGVKAINEYQDGHKTVDIAIPSAKIFIEVDGLQHLTDPKQILSDFKRDHFSDGDDFHTIRIPNKVIEDRLELEKVANAIAEVAHARIK
jgi:very-short-patch-repair endonuclease